MPTILFEQIPGGEPVTPPPDGVGYGEIVLTSLGFEDVNAGFGFIELVQGPSAYDPSDPLFSIGYGEIALVAGYSFGHSVLPPGTGYGEIVLTSRGYEEVDVGYGEIVLTSIGYETPPPPIPLYPTDRMADFLAVGSSALGNHTVLMQLRLVLSDSQSFRLESGVMALRDYVAFDDFAPLVFHEILTASLAMGGTLTTDFIALAQMQDALILSGVVSNYLEAYDVLLDALVFGDLFGTWFHLGFADALAMGDAINQAFTAAAGMLDNLAMGDSQTSIVTFGAIMSDALALGDVGGSVLTAHSVLRDGVRFALNFTFDNMEYVAYSINTETKGLSKYTAYPFNSFFRLAGKHYGATDTGVYLLEGDDDDGEPINTRMRRGMSALGDNKLKRAPAVYLGYRADGNLLLKAVVANQTTGEREANVYTLTPVGAGSMREGRIPIGKGLRSVYWDFIIENVDGADSEIDSLEILPVVLDRRVRGNSAGDKT